MIASITGTRAVQALWASIGVQVAGQIIDLRWHATHREFETGADQLDAHWLLWTGALLTIAIAGLAMAQSASRQERTSYAAVLVASLLYAALSVWHFVAHVNGEDPELAHVLIAVAKAAILVSAVLATLAWRRERRRGAHP